MPFVWAQLGKTSLLIGDGKETHLMKSCWGGLEGEACAAIWAWHGLYDSVVGDKRRASLEALLDRVAFGFPWRLAGN